ncbi:WW domain containing protein [Trema orientale]|uniref:Polyglutamine-binding protein 1 n=1 Tax=Trema orientale TaxID=63057 RepID=A0A2P5E7J9_TREOI|nr:WW domain containing protein [Trema orientale]
MFQEKDHNQEINNVDRNGQNSNNSTFSPSHPETDVNGYNIEHNNTPDIPPTDYSRVHMGNDSEIETAVQDAVLRQQLGGGGGGEAKGVDGSLRDNTDIFSEHHDPNAIKEHLLKMTTEHRAEMALKRGRSTLPEEGNTEIGNGYGVPGGGAYNGGSRSNLSVARNLGAGTNEMGEKNSAPDGESERNPAAKELPEYLKQKLRARGILKDEPEKSNPKFETRSTQVTEKATLPPGWVEAKDPASGAFYYYNETTGMSQWERPVETPTLIQPPTSHQIEDWVEALDETTGILCTHGVHILLCYSILFLDLLITSILRL